MKLKTTKAFGCGLAVSSFLMMSAFSSIEADAVNDTEDNTSIVGSIVGEVELDINNLVDTVEEMKQEQLEAVKNSPWYNKAMVDIKNSLNIRSEANIDSPVVGVIYKGGAVEILERGDEWTRVRSGEVEGYAATEYLAFGEAAQEIAERDGERTASVQVDGLRIRKGAGEEEQIAGVVNKGEALTVQEEEEGWIKIKYAGEDHYVSADYVEVSVDLNKAKTMEEIEKERQAEEQRRREQQEKEAARNAAVSGSGSSAGSSSSDAAESASANVGSSDLALMAAIIECEAGGESYEGKVAVGAVVMNRVRSGSFPNSINGVVYQKGQFGPASSGKLAKVLARGANSSCVQAAQAALGGSNNIGSALYFKNASAGKGTIIGNHCFY